MNFRLKTDEELSLLPHSFTDVSTLRLCQYGSTARMQRKRTASVPAQLFVRGPRDFVACEQTKKKARVTKKPVYYCNLPASRSAASLTCSLQYQDNSSFYGLIRKHSVNAKMSLPKAEMQEPFVSNVPVVPGSPLNESEMPLVEDRKQFARSDGTLYAGQTAVDTVSVSASESLLGDGDNAFVVDSVQNTSLYSQPIFTESRSGFEGCAQAGSLYNQSIDKENSALTDYNKRNEQVKKGHEGFFFEGREGEEGSAISIPGFFASNNSYQKVSGKVERNQSSFALKRLVDKNTEASSDGRQCFEKEEEEEADEVSCRTALLNFVPLSISGALVIAFTFALFTLPLAFVGNYLGELYLTGASVGFFVLSIVVLYPTLGMTVAIDTLCSHEYGRDSNSQKLGIFLQRGICVSLTFFIPMCFIIYKIDYFLLKIYDPQVTAVAVDFLSYMFLLVPPMIIFSAFTKFLFNQMQPQMPLIALAAGFCISPFVQMKLTPMGVRYTMIGMCITAWWQLLVIIAMTFYNPQTRHSFGGLSLSQALELQEVVEYLSLSVPSAVFVFAEASSFDFTILLCASFGKEAGAAWSGIMNVLFVFVSFAGGMSVSACMNIGYCVGAHKPVSLRTYITISIFLTITVAIFNSTILYFFFDFFMSLFGTKGVTLKIARQTIFLLPFFHIADSVQYMAQGIFSGLGKNHLGALILLLSLWAVGIPLAFLLGVYFHYGVFGVCLGMTIGLCIEAPALVAVVYKMDYSAICDAFDISSTFSSDSENEIQEEGV